MLRGRAESPPGDVPCMSPDAVHPEVWAAPSRRASQPVTLVQIVGRNRVMQVSPRVPRPVIVAVRSAETGTAEALRPSRGRTRDYPLI